MEKCNFLKILQCPDFENLWGDFWHPFQPKKLDESDGGFCFLRIIFSSHVNCELRASNSAKSNFLWIKNMYRWMGNCCNIYPQNCWHRRVEQNKNLANFFLNLFFSQPPPLSWEATDSLYHCQIFTFSVSSEPFSAFSLFVVRLINLLGHLFMPPLLPWISLFTRIIYLPCLGPNLSSLTYLQHTGLRMEARWVATLRIAYLRLAYW